MKIDRSFVEGLETHADDRAVVAAIIGMAKALHLDTVGEGVETAGQLDILRTLGCTRVQGYYLGRPVPGDDIGRCSLAGDDDLDALKLLEVGVPARRQRLAQCAHQVGRTFRIR